MASSSLEVEAPLLPPPPSPSPSNVTLPSPLMAALLDAAGKASVDTGHRLNFSSLPIMDEVELPPVVTTKRKAATTSSSSPSAGGSGGEANNKRRRVTRREWIQPVVAAFRGHLLSNCSVATSTASLYGCLGKSLMQSICDNVIAKGVLPGLQEDYEGVKTVIINHPDVVRDHILSGKHQRYTAVLSYLSRFISGEGQNGTTLGGHNKTSHSVGAEGSKLECPSCLSPLEQSGSTTSCGHCGYSQEGEGSELNGQQGGATDDETDGSGDGTSVSSPVSISSNKKPLAAGGGLSRWAEENKRLQKRMEELEGKCEEMESSRKTEVQHKNQVLVQLQQYHAEILRLSRAVESLEGGDPSFGGVMDYLGRIQMLESQAMELKRQNVALQRCHEMFIQGVTPNEDNTPGAPLFRLKTPNSAQAILATTASIFQ